MVKTSIFLLLLISIIIAALRLEASVPMKTFYYVDERKNWNEAQLYCKEHFTDLAFVKGQQEMDLLTELVKSRAWVGLYRDPRNNSVWRWVGERGDASSDPHWAYGYLHWYCGFLVKYSRRWYSMRCSSRLPYVCYVDNLVLVKENKTWEEALEHCRAIGGGDDSSLSNHYRDHQYDLVSLQSEDDHHHAKDRIQEATTSEVWTALRFLASEWLWVDGESLQYQNLPHCPARWRHCGTLPKDNSTQWEIRDCMERRNFLCIKSPEK